MERLRRFVWGLLYFLCSTSLVAQVDTLEQVANRIPDLPAVIIMEVSTSPYQMIGGGIWLPDSLSLAAARMGSMADLLRSAPSVALKRYAPGGLSTPSMRGMGAGHTQVYWEGLPLNGAALGQSDLSLGAMGQFDNCVTAMGGSSLMLGSGGLGGGIVLGNSNRLYPSPYHSEFRIASQVGSWGTSNNSLSWLVGKKGFSSKTSAYLFTSQNNFPYRTTDNQGEEIQQRLQHAATTQAGFLQSFLMGSPYKLQAGLQAWGILADRQLPPAIGTSSTLETQTDHNLRLKLDLSRLRKGENRLQAGYFLESMDYAAPLTLIYARMRGSRLVMDYRRSPRVLGPPRLLSLPNFGVRYMRDQVMSDGLDTTRQQQQLSAMACLQLGWRRLGNAALLIRQELNDYQLSPTMGRLAFQFPGAYISPFNLHAALSRNYRYPSLNDRYWQPGGNPDLRPELSHSAEIGFELRQGVVMRELPRVRLNGYYNDVRDWIQWVPGTSGFWQPMNLKHVRAWGVENRLNWTTKSADGGFSGQYELGHHLSIATDEAGRQLIYVPRHTAFARVMLRWNRWNLQVFQDWNTRRFTLADNSAFLRGFSTTDISVGWEHWLPQRHSFLPASDRMLALQFGAQNLLNIQYQTVAQRPMPGRYIYLRVEFNFAHAYK